MTPPPAGGDPFIYHLSFPASWYKAGRIFYVPLPYGAQAATYYPLNTELWYLWGMVAWGEDFLSNLGQVWHWALAGAAVAAAARHSGIKRAGAAIGGMAAMLIPGVIQQVTVARVDVAFSAWMLVSTYFAMKWGETRRPGHLALFGMSFGLFIGTKSLASVYCAVPAAMFLFQISDRGKKAPLDIAAAAIPVLALGGFWYVRNWAQTGNPFFPLDFSLGGTTIFKGAYGSDAMKLFHTSDKDELKRIGLFFVGMWMLGGIMFSEFLAMGLILIRRRSGIGRLFMLSAPWAVAALFWYVNPHNNLTNGRFMFPAFMFFCYSIALVVDGAKEKWAYIWGLLVLASAIGSGVMSGTDHFYKLLHDIAFAAAGRGNSLLAPAGTAIRLLIPGAALLMWSALSSRRAAKTVGGLAGAALFTAGMFFAWNYHIEYKYNWYASFKEGAGWGMVEKMTKGQSLNIAAVGSERIYGLFGSGLRHNVSAISVTENPSLDFHQYWKDAGEPKSEGNERPQLHRERGSADAWIANLRRDNVNLVFATTLDPMSQGVMERDPDGFPEEVSWAEQRSDALRLKFKNETVRIYAVIPENRGAK